MNLKERSPSFVGGGGGGGDSLSDRFTCTETNTDPSSPRHLINIFCVT